MNDDPQWGGTRKGAGRKPTFHEAARSFNVCLPDTLTDALAEAAAKNNANFNRLLAAMIRHGLKNLAQVVEGLK